MKKLITCLTAAIMSMTSCLLPFDGPFPLNNVSAKYDIVEEFPDFDLDVYVASLMANEMTISGCDSTIYKNLNFYVNDEKTPTKIVYDELCNDDDFTASVASWKAMKFVFEPSDSISDVLDQTDYYEMVLLSLLGGYIEENETLKELNAYNSGIKAAVDEVKALAVVSDNDFDFNSLSDVEQGEFLSNFGEIFEKKFGVKGSFPDIHDTMMQGVDYSLKLANTLDESMRKAVAFWHCANLSNETKAVLEDMYAIAVSTEADSNLTAALKNVIQSFDDTGALWESIFNAEGEVLQDLILIGLDAFWEGLMTQVMPEWFVLKIGYEVGTFISNSLFSTDEIIEQFYKMGCLVDYEQLIRTTVSQEIEDFKSEQTKTNANVLFASVDLMYDAYDLSCDYAIDYADIVFNAPASEVYDTLHFMFTGSVNRYDNFVESVNNLREYAEDSSEIPDTHYKGDLILDYPEIYNALIEQEEQERYEASIIHVTGVGFLYDVLEVGLEDDFVMFDNAIISPSDATMKELIYSSSDPSIAEYVGGDIKVYQEGTATITVTTVDGGYTASVVVNVVEGHGENGEVFEPVELVHRFVMDGLLYKVISDDEVMVVDSSDTITGTLTIPNEVEDEGIIYKVTEADREVFDLEHITRIEIPANLSDIENSYMGLGPLNYYCPELEEIFVDPNNNSYSSVDGVLYNKKHTYILWYPAKKTDSEYYILHTVTDLCDAFDNCEYLNFVYIPSSIKWYQSTFCDCANLYTLAIDTAYYYSPANLVYDCLVLFADTYNSSPSVIYNGIEGTNTSSAGSPHGFYTYSYGLYEQMSYYIDNMFYVTYCGVGTNGPKMWQYYAVYKGDVNGDNSFGVADLVALQKGLLEEQPFTYKQWLFADINEDYVVDVFDIVDMRRQLTSD